MRAQRTRESRELGKASPEERERRRAEMRALGDRIATGERELTEVERQFEQLMLGMRNLPRPYVPVGKSEADNKIVRSEGRAGASSRSSRCRIGSWASGWGSSTSSAG